MSTRVFSAMVHSPPTSPTAEAAATSTATVDANNGRGNNFSLGNLPPSPIVKRKFDDMSRIRTFSLDSEEEYGCNYNISGNYFDDDDGYDIAVVDDDDYNDESSNTKRRKPITSIEGKDELALITPEANRNNVEIIVDANDNVDDSKLLSSLFLDNVECVVQGQKHSFEDVSPMATTFLQPKLNRFDDMTGFNNHDADGDADPQDALLDSGFGPFPLAEMDIGDSISIHGNEKTLSRPSIRGGQVYQSLKSLLPLPESLQPILCLLLHMESSVDDQALVKYACHVVQETMKSYHPRLDTRQVSGTIFEALVGNLGSTIDLGSLFEASANQALEDPNESVAIFFQAAVDDNDDTHDEAESLVGVNVATTTTAEKTRPSSFVPTILQFAIAYGAYHSSTAKLQTMGGLEYFVKEASKDLESMTALQKEQFWNDAVAAWPDDNMMLLKK